MNVPDVLRTSLREMFEMTYLCCSNVAKTRPEHVAFFLFRLLCYFSFPFVYFWLCVSRLGRWPVCDMHSFIRIKTLAINYNRGNKATFLYNLLTVSPEMRNLIPNTRRGRSQKGGEWKGMDSR